MTLAVGLTTINVSYINVFWKHCWRYWHTILMWGHGHIYIGPIEISWRTQNRGGL